MKIKVCGLKYPQNIKAIAALKPDYMGFICYEKTPRFIGELPVDTLKGLTAYKTGVFVNESFDTIVDKINEYDLDAVQLHGDESPGICAALKNKETLILKDVTIVTKGGREVKKLGSESTKRVTLDKDVIVIKAFGVDENFDFNVLDAYADSVDYFMFDTKTSIYGGSGKTFNWDILQNYKLNKPFFLSGGISMDNLEQISQIKHPQFYAVDLNSKFEVEPGLKDVQKLEQAFKKLRS